MASPDGVPVFLECSDVARILGLALKTVQRLDKTGELRPVARTVRGSRLYRLEEVERIKAARELAKQEAPLAATRIKRGKPAFFPEDIGDQVNGLSNAFADRFMKDRHAESE